MFCFNEFAFTVQVEHKTNSTQILGFILICLYFTTGHFQKCVLCKECSLFPFKFLAQFSATVPFLWGYTRFQRTQADIDGVLQGRTIVQTLNNVQINLPRLRQVKCAFSTKQYNLVGLPV